MEYNIENWQEKIVKLDTGINMCYYEVGPRDGIPMILLHGVTDGHISWTQVAPLLGRAGYKCYILEYRGNGKTDKPEQGEAGYTAELLSEDIICLLEKLEIEKAHFVGHSFGSLICQVLGNKIPEKILSISLLDTAVSCKENPVLNWVACGDETFEGVFNCKDKLSESFIEEWTAMENEDEVFKKATFNYALNMPLVAWQNLMRGLLRFNGEEYLKNLKCRIMVLWGTEDSIFPKEEQEKVKKCLAGKEVSYVDVIGASHNGFWDSIEMAEKYAHIIDDFAKNCLQL